jgi:hypothetical protein
MPHTLRRITLGELLNESARALSLGFRPKKYAVPWNSLVPDFICKLITPPELCPNSASVAFCCTLSSETASIGGT